MRRGLPLRLGLGLALSALLALLALLVAAGWLAGDRMAWPSWLTGAKAPAAAGLKKCLGSNGQVLYSDQACPAGTRTQGVAGRLTVVPGQPVAPAAAASTLPNARDLLLKPDAVDIQARRMDEVIGK